MMSFDHCDQLPPLPKMRGQYALSSCTIRCLLVLAMLASNPWVLEVVTLKSIVSVSQLLAIAPFVKERAP